MFHFELGGSLYDNIFLKSKMISYCDLFLLNLLSEKIDVLNQIVL